MNTSDFERYNPSQDLLNSKLISQALWECLVDNDIECFLEILEGHLTALKLSIH